MSFRIVLTCPECGSDSFVNKNNGVFKCEKCGTVPYIEDMVETRQPSGEIVVPVNDMKLCAWKGSDPDCPSVGIGFYTEDGMFISLAIAEVDMESGGTDIDVYTYDDVYKEDWQRKFVIRKSDIDVALFVDDFLKGE